MPKNPRRKCDPEILSETKVHEGDWIDAYKLTYRNAGGFESTWEAIKRKRDARASVMIARLRPSGRYILIRQFRPPTGADVLEFPAGLIDEGESPEQAAVRELREETGYHGVILKTSPDMVVSPGIVSERCHFVFMDVDESAPENINPVHDQECSEFIEVMLVAPKDIATFFEAERARRTIIDIKLYAYFVGFPNSTEFPDLNKTPESTE